MTASINPPSFTTLGVEDDRTGLGIETLKRAFLDNLYYIQGKLSSNATPIDNYLALAYTVRDRLIQRWLSTGRTMEQQDAKIVGYLSAEYLVGPHLANNMLCMDTYAPIKQAIEELGLDLQELIDLEEEPGLGNGGLGRLAACYMDSLATLQVPAIGYGIRYEFGIFDQEICDGWQVEITDKWLKYGNPWEVARPQEAVEVKLGGHTESYVDDQNRYRVRWIPDLTITGIPYDTPILGYKVNTANTLRLWKAAAPESFDFAAFNQGNYLGAVNAKVVSENITKVLYPNDEPIQGKKLRLKQQFFFVSCSLQDVLRRHLGCGRSPDTLPDKFAVQMNDTHPAIAVAELMRLLVDDHQVDWDTAWDVTTRTLAFTNHTLLPEALEKWSISIFGELLPRHLQIIYEINHRFLDQVRMQYPSQPGKVSHLSLIDESGPRYVRMANLACVGSHAINGVAALHSELLKETILRDFYELWPEKFQNKTNGVTPRRWIAQSNPGLANLINRQIGSDRWLTHLEDLRQLEPCADDAGFREEWRNVKRDRKQQLADHTANCTDFVINPDTLFDIQVKRLHEYKRQHLNVLHIITLYNRIKDNPNLEMTPRTCIFGGKAAPSYDMAKLMIKLITAVGEVVNRDPVVGDRLKVVFLPDFNVTLGQRIYPAADLSEQISLAGKEASGTGNMKFALNGAITIGTLDGANLEIRQEVGPENFFLFGMTAEEVMARRAQGYHPSEIAQANPHLKRAIGLIATGHFSHGDPDLFRPLVNDLLHHDPFMLLADYQSYVDCQDQVSQAYQDVDHWTRMSILNTARMGKFSSDRAIRQYCEDIWYTPPVPVQLHS